MDRYTYDHIADIWAYIRQIIIIQFPPDVPVISLQDFSVSVNEICAN